MKEIKDSGHRREFASGAVRDIAEGKGRCDLIPLDVAADLLEESYQSEIVYDIHLFMQQGRCDHLYSAVRTFISQQNMSPSGGLLEVSKQYEGGALKYGEHNWEKGIPLHCYIDSALRHLFKYFDGWEDEPHDRAFVWNILGAIWTMRHRTDCIDVNFNSSVDNDD